MWVFMSFLVYRAPTDCEVNLNLLKDLCNDSSKADFLNYGLTQLQICIKNCFGGWLYDCDITQWNPENAREIQKTP